MPKAQHFGASVHCPGCADARLARLVRQAHSPGRLMAVIELHDMMSSSRRANEVLNSLASCLAVTAFQVDAREVGAQRGTAVNQQALWEGPHDCTKEVGGGGVTAIWPGGVTAIWPGGRVEVSRDRRLPRWQLAVLEAAVPQSLTGAAHHVAFPHRVSEVAEGLALNNIAFQQDLQA